MAATPKAQVFRLLELVEYQNGTIVSRQITKTGAGNVTLFAFDKDQELSEHTAPFDALVHVLDGQMQVMIAAVSFELNDGEAIILPANEPHALKAIKRSKMVLTMIRA